MKYLKFKFESYLIRGAEQAERLANKLRGAADRLSTENQVFIADCERTNWENVRTCFVLSTGRCGTFLLNKILQTSPNAYPEHKPKPELYRTSKLAYEQIDKNPDLFKEVIKSAREEYLLKAARQKRVFIETNNQITFFAPIIKDVFPNTTFIHLVRHPGDFVRSGIRRNWYTGKHDHDIGRIVPISDEIKERWQEFSSIEKIGWLWNETNQFIEDFRETLAGDYLLFVKAEELFTDPQVTEKIFKFLYLDGFQRKKLQKLIQTPVNRQRKGRFSEYKNWTQNNKQQLKNIATLAEKYGYEL
ncbi:sulfotransferase [candidate division KSB1 bacterium]|nr:sulfotransferase [candidate division KSB1 bacterium]